MATSTPPNWDVSARVSAVLREHEHPDMTVQRLEAMTRAARETFAAAMRERGTDPDAFELVVHIDELVGPMAFVVELGGKKRSWPLPAFQGQISQS